MAFLTTLQLWRTLRVIAKTHDIGLDVFFGTRTESVLHELAHEVTLNLVGKGTDAIGDLLARHDVDYRNQMEIAAIKVQCAAARRLANIHYAPDDLHEYPGTWSKTPRLGMRAFQPPPADWLTAMLEAPLTEFEEASTKKLVRYVLRRHSKLVRP